MSISLTLRPFRRQVFSGMCHAKPENLPLKPDLRKGGTWGGFRRSAEVRMKLHWLNHWSPSSS